MNKLDFSWANGSVDSVSTLLAKKASMVKQAPDLKTQLNDTVTDNVNKVTDPVYQGLKDSLKWGLGGVGVGALVGGLSSLGTPEKKRRTLSDIATGAMIGGLGGTGIGLASSALGAGKATGPGSAEWESKKDQAEQLKNERLERNNYQGWNGGTSRLHDVITGPFRGLKAWWSGGEGGKEEAINNADIGGWRHWNSTEDGLPAFPNAKGGLIPNLSRGHITSLTTGSTPKDVLLATGAADVFLSALKKSPAWKDPAFIRAGLNHPDAANLIADAAKHEALKQQFAARSTDELVRLQRGQNINTGVRPVNGAKAFNFESYIKPDTIKGYAQTQPSAEAIGLIPPNIEHLKTNARRLLDTRLQPLIDAQGTNIVAVEGTNSGNKLMQPPSNATRAQAYINTLVKAYPTELTQRSQTLAKYGLTPQEVAQHLYHDVRVIGHETSPSIAVAEQMSNIANNTTQFDAFRAQTAGGKKTAITVPQQVTPVYDAINNKYVDIKSNPAELNQEGLMGFARQVPSTPHDILRLNLRHKAMTATGHEKEWMERMARLPDKILEEVANKAIGSGTTPGIGYLDRGGVIQPNIMDKLRQYGIDTLQKEHAEKHPSILGRVFRSSFGGVGSNPSLLTREVKAPWPEVSNPLDQGRKPWWGNDASTKIRSYGRYGVGAASKMPRWSAYGLPLALNEWLHRRGSGNLMSNYDPEVKDTAATMATPEYAPFVNEEFNTKSRTLAEQLLGKEELAKAPKLDNLSDREKFEINKVLSRTDIDKYTRLGHLMHILGTRTGVRPYEHENFVGTKK